MYVDLPVSSDVAPESEKMPCIKIDKPLVVYRFSGKNDVYNNVALIIFMSYNKLNLTFVLLCNSLRKIDKCSTSLAFYRLAITRLIKSIKHEHSCKILYISYKTQAIYLILNFFSFVDSCSAYFVLDKSK